MIKSLVSIIIPTFNRADLIGETLDSVLAQTYANWECIIVDDGSTDNTFQIIKNYCDADSRFKYYSRPLDRPKGGNACRNFGFEMSEGEFVNWFDSDDIMLPVFLEKKVEILRRRNLDAVIARLCFFTDNISNLSYENRTNFSDDLLTDFLTLKITWYLPDVMWRSEFLVDKELFNEKLLVGQDRDFHSRMLLKNPRIVSILDVLTFYRMHDSNLTKNNSKNREIIMKISHLASIDKLLIDIMQSSKLNKTVKKHYFKMLIRYYPYVKDNIEERKRLFKLLRLLYFFNAEIFFTFFKFIVARISYLLTGRGAFLLK